MKTKFRLCRALGYGNYEPVTRRTGSFIEGTRTTVLKARKIYEEKFPNKFFRDREIRKVNGKWVETGR